MRERQVERLGGQRPQLLGRHVLVAQPPGDLLQALGVGGQAAGGVGAGHPGTSAPSAAIRPRIPLTRPGASAWQ